MEPPTDAAASAATAAPVQVEETTKLSAEDQRLKDRAARFGLTDAAAMDEKKRKRAERFNVPFVESVAPAVLVVAKNNNNNNKKQKGNNNKKPATAAAAASKPQQVRTLDVSLLYISNILSQNHVFPQ